MRNLSLLATRLVLGGYVAVHGSQKLFGAFGGGGIEPTAEYFETIGLKPGKPMAALAGSSEMAGGLLTATGIAFPAGPLTIAATMLVAASTHLEHGALNRDGGFELPMTNFAAALALVAAGPGVFRLGPRLPKRFTALVMLGGAAMAGASINKVLTARRQSEDARAGSLAAQYEPDELPARTQPTPPRIAETPAVTADIAGAGNQAEGRVEDVDDAGQSPGETQPIVEPEDETKPQPIVTAQSETPSQPGGQSQTGSQSQTGGQSQTGSQSHPQAQPNAGAGSQTEAGEKAD